MFIIDDLLENFTESLGTGIMNNYVAATQISSNGLKDLCDINNSQFAPLFKLSSTIFQGLAAVGIGMCLVYFLFGIIDKLTKDRLNAYTLIRSFIELMVGLVATNCSFDALKWVTNLGSIKLNGLASLTDIIGTEAGDIIETTNKNTIIKAFSLGDGSTPARQLFPRLLGYILSIAYLGFSLFIMAMLISVILSRNIQIAIYLAMAPIPIANVFNRGSIMESSAIAYVRKIAALGLQGALITLVLSCENVLTSMSNYLGTLVGGTDGATSAIFTLIILVMLKMLVLKMAQRTGQLANDITS